MSDDPTDLLAPPKQRQTAPGNEPLARRLERRVGYLLWALAFGCLLLAGLVWWRLLAG